MSPPPTVEMPTPSLIESSAHILVIEDEPKIARWLVSLLKQAKFTVDTAPDGATGLRLARPATRQLSCSI